jgi:hypothetical protein
MLAHLFDDIMAKGVTRNYNTKPNEQMHGSLKDSYLLRTNFKDIAAQVNLICDLDVSNKCNGCSRFFKLMFG